MISKAGTYSSEDAGFFCFLSLDAVSFSGTLGSCGSAFFVFLADGLAEVFAAVLALLEAVVLRVEVFVAEALGLGVVFLTAEVFVAGFWAIPDTL